MRIGIFGGSFNPVHRGHLELALSAFSELNLDHLYFVPTFETPLKSAGALLPAEARLRLLQKALRPYPYFSVSTCEIERQGKSYTVDTLKYFHSKASPNDRFYFLSGTDVLEKLGQWKSAESIFNLCRFVVATRPGSAWRETGFPVIRMPFEALAVSSSAIRSRLKKKGSIEALVPVQIAPDLEKFYRLTQNKKKQKKETHHRNKKKA